MDKELGHLAFAGKKWRIFKQNCRDIRIANGATRQLIVILETKPHYAWVWGVNIGGRRAI